MEKMEELHRELMLSQKNDELTLEAKDLLAELVDEIMNEWYNDTGKYSIMGKEELVKGGKESVFKYWKNFNCEKQNNPRPYFKEVFLRGVAKHYYKSTKEYKEKRFLDSLMSMGRKILLFDLPYEIELDGPTIRKFTFVDKD